MKDKIYQAYTARDGRSAKERFDFLVTWTDLTKEEIAALSRHFRSIAYSYSDDIAWSIEEEAHEYFYAINGEEVFRLKDEMKKSGFYSWFESRGE